MDKIIDLLFSRLSERGVAASHVPYLVRDIMYSVGNDIHISPEDINIRLDSLGWGKDILDEYTLELILSATNSGKTGIGNSLERKDQWIT